MKKRVLVTGVGGPAAVAFMNALPMGQFDLHAVDIDPYAPGLYLVPSANRHLVMRGDHPDFVSHLIALCEKHGIDAVVPTVDAELLPLARGAGRFEAIGVKVMVASEATLETCIDKWLLLTTCSGTVPVPWSTLGGAPMSWSEMFPCIVKPRTGSGSRGVFKIDSVEALRKVSLSDKLIVQQYLPGEEYSVDVYVGKDGSLRAAVPRLRLKVDSGVAVTSRTVRIPELSRYAAKVARIIQLRGVANIQFRRDSEGMPRLLEVNARFAGTMSLTVRSGVNMPALALDELFGTEPPPGPWEFEEIAMVRTYRETYLPPRELVMLEESFQQDSPENRSNAAPGL